jgi:hypothetical protein
MEPFFNRREKRLRRWVRRGKVEAARVVEAGVVAELARGGWAVARDGVRTRKVMSARRAGMRGRAGCRDMGISWDRSEPAGMAGWAGLWRVVCGWRASSRTERARTGEAMR